MRTRGTLIARCICIYDPRLASGAPHISERMSLPVNEGYGGIWINGRPFIFNAKCVVIGLVVVGVYALPRFAGTANWFMMAFIFCLVYIGISIYDVMYKCSPFMYSSSHSILGLFKPQHRGESLKDQPLLPGTSWAPNQEAAYVHSINWAHTVLFMPLVIAALAMAMRCKKAAFEEHNVPTELRDYSILPIALGLGAVGFLYHGMRLVWPRDVSC